MTSRITSYDPPTSFVDEQVTGPFASLRHEHEFHNDGGGTRMLDRLTFSTPLGPLGLAAEFLFLEGYLRRLILTRAKFLKKLAEQGAREVAD
jgi:ligand-binding SRPBCC domain-containing protein